MIEVATGIAGGIRQRRPQLHTMQNGRRVAIAWQRHFRVANSGAGSHQIELTRANDRVYARTVAVFHLAAEQPADRLQSSVWMRRNVHPAEASKIVWAVVIGKAPCADQRPLLLGKCATDSDRPRPAQRNLPRSQHLDSLEL